jgi:hypothetical protein
MLPGVETTPAALPLDRDLSAATARGDAARILTLLESSDVSMLLQAAGEALLVAAAAGVAIPTDLAGSLAGQLDAGVGWRR